MFEKDTAIVLGAGASWHYGHPTGEQLIDDVKHFAVRLRDSFQMLMSEPNLRRSIALEFGDTSNFRAQLANLIAKLEQIEPLVIDYFLGHNPELAKLGKFVIACALLEREAKFLKHRRNLNRGRDDRGKDDWGRFLVQGMLDGYRSPEDLMRNKITFITFNYDLSLERRLFGALSAIDSLRAKDFPKSFLEDSRVIHVYGKLGEDYTSELRLVDQGMNLEFTQVIAAAFEAAKGIKTIAPFEKTQDNAVKLAQKRLFDAKFVYFLGYGFDRNNNELLGLSNFRSSGTHNIYFTNFENKNKIGKLVAQVFGLGPDKLLGDNYVAYAHHNPGSNSSHIHLEKSIRNVYDALAIDFDWPT